MDYTVYQGIENKRKSYVAVSAEVKPDEAIKIANRHYKLNGLCLKAEAGYVIGDDLYAGYPDSKKATPVWIITRKRG